MREAIPGSSRLRNRAESLEGLFGLKCFGKDPNGAMHTRRDEPEEILSTVGKVLRFDGTVSVPYLDA